MRRGPPSIKLPTAPTTHCHSLAALLLHACQINTKSRRSSVAGSGRSIEERWKKEAECSLPLRSFPLWTCGFGQAKAMEHRGSGSEKTKPVLVLVLLMSCLLLPLPLVSSVPLSRSMSLGNRQASASSLEVPVQGTVLAAAEERNMGEVAARMDIEVNDYPGSCANGRHDPPRSPGRA